MREAAGWAIEELSGDRLPDLETAQKLALTDWAPELGRVLRDLLGRGLLVNRGGRLVVNQAELESIEHERIYQTP